MLITQPGFKMQGRKGLGWGESVRGSDPAGHAGPPCPNFSFSHFLGLMLMLPTRQ